MSTVAEKKPRAAKKARGVGVIERLGNEADEPKQMQRTRMLISVNDIDRHPDNRTPTPAAIAAVAESLRTEGQLEPILVRPLDGEAPYQVISGETRWLAAVRLGWESLTADVVELDDAAALRVLAAANAARQDLDPIAKARLIVRLCQPVAEGGSGLTREAAAKVFDLQSGGAASNLVRLLELPQYWVDRVASGELPQSFARELLRVLVLGLESPAWESLLASWSSYQKDPSHWDSECWRSREELSQEIDHLLTEHSRPVEKGDKRSYYEQTGSFERHAMLFKLTPNLEEELRIVELDLGDGEVRRRATNCTLYDSFQIPAIKNRFAKKNAGKSGDSGTGLKDEGSPLTPKQQAAAEAERRAEAAEKLTKRIERWRAAWLRELVAQVIVEEDHSDLAIRLAAWQQRQVRTLSYGVANTLGLDEAMNEIWGVRDPWQFVLRGKGCGGVPELVAHWLRCPARDGFEHPMPDDKVEDLVELLELDLDDAWLVMQSSGTRPERMQEFFELHNSEQLDTLGRELDVGTVHAPKKSDKVALFMGSPKTLKLPRCLRSLRGKRGGK